MSIIIIDNYDSFTYNIVQQVKQISGQEVTTIFNDQITFEQLKAKRPNGVVLSPGPGHPSKSRDFGICAEIIERKDELDCPILGICLGHQGIAFKLGGSIELAEEVVHGKTSELDCVAESKLFKGLPRSFSAMRYHSLVVSRNSLPESLKVTAVDRKTNQIMAIEHRDSPLFGLQFHPESIGTTCGADIMRNFSELCM